MKFCIKDTVNFNPMIIKDKAKLKKIIERAKRAGKSVVIKKGVYDIIHPGHIHAIRQMKKMADIVIISIMSDKQVKKLKGKMRPINTQKQRGQVVDGIAGVDYSFLDKSGSGDEYRKVINYLKPTILVITKVDPKKRWTSDDQTWKIVETDDKMMPEFSSTKIINKIIAKAKNKN